MSMEDIDNNSSRDNIFLSQYIVEMGILSPYCAVSVLKLNYF